MGSEAILLIGSHYEATNPGSGQQATKYYTSPLLSAGFAGTTRIAMRKYTIPSSMAVEYFLTDHLGSTSITTNTNGAKVSEMRYKPCPLRYASGMLREGEIRYSWTSNPSTTPAYKLPQYTFTGQFSYMDDPSTAGVMEGFGLMFYNARWMDPALGRFIQADSIVPGGVQGLDRYAYVNNSPIMYIDPSGHTSLCGTTCEAEYEKPQYSLYDVAEMYGITFVDDTVKWNVKDKAAAVLAAIAIGRRFGERTGRDGATVFREVFGPLTFKMVKQYEYNGGLYEDGACACGGPGTILFASFYQWDKSYTRSRSTTLQMNRNLVVHELGHLYYHAVGTPALDGLTRDALIPNPCDGCKYWQQHPPSMNENNEEIPTELFADTFLAWTFNAWNPDPRRTTVLAVDNAQNAMNNIAQNAMPGPVP